MTRRPLRVNGQPIPRDIANGSPGDFARFCGETDPAVLAILDAEVDEEEDVTDQPATGAASTNHVSLADGSGTTRPSGKWPSTTGSTDDR